jgi:two-component system, sensor histidine kinase and response regulator
MPATTPFPAATMAGAFAALTTPPSDSEPRRTLLIVDDEEGPRQSLRVIFREEYRLLLASSGEAALELVNSDQIDVAILDIRMEGMNGVELLGRIKQIDPGIEVVMLTAFETIDTIRQALRHGACDYLNKPFDIHQIRAAVAHAMERRALNVAIRQNNHQLDVLQQELENQRLQEEIVRSRGDIYASIIHDINGPLTIISGFIQVINRRIGDTQQVEGESLDIVKDRLNRITRQVTSCIDISRRYLSFLRQDPMERSKVGVNQILADLGELLKVHPSVGRNQLGIHQLVEDVTVEINGTDLIQILLNLTINALQAVDAPHEVAITGALQRRPLDMSLMREGPHDRVINPAGFKNGDQLLVLAVRDDGPGIPETVLTRMFEPCFTTKPAGKGNGLGLTIVKRLVSEANGLLHLSSREGGGTTFTIYLPAEPRV